MLKINHYIIMAILLSVLGAVGVIGRGKLTHLWSPQTDPPLGTSN